jgi:hypothetical protein
VNIKANGVGLHEIAKNRFGNHMYFKLKNTFLLLFKNTGAESETAIPEFE